MYKAELKGGLRQIVEYKKLRFAGLSFSTLAILISSASACFLSMPTLSKPGEEQAGGAHQFRSKPGGAGPWVPVVAEDKFVRLTDHEKDIAKKIGFDEKVLVLIKERLHPEMGIVKSGGLEPPDMEFVETNHVRSAPLLEKDQENYERLAKQFPELKDLIDQELKRYSPPSAHQALKDVAENQMKTELGPEKYKRYQRFVAETAPYRLLVEQEMKGIQERSSHRGGKWLLDPSAFIDSDEALEKAISDLKASVVGKTLKPENRAEKYLGLRFPGVGDERYVSDRRIPALRTELEALGYRITEEVRGRENSKQFETLAEAEKYLRESGTSINSMSLNEQKSQSRQVTFPPDLVKSAASLENDKQLALQTLPGLAAATPEELEMIAKGFGSGAASSGSGRQLFPRLRIWPGSAIKKVGDKQWLIDTPARYTATALTRVATVMKCPPQEAGFDIVRAKGTNGVNYGIENDDVIAKLKDWDTRYGVTVLEASMDSMKIRFKTLPDDLSELMTEIYLFDPEIELSPNENSNASIMRDLARKLRETKVADFWWD